MCAKVLKNAYKSKCFAYYFFEMFIPLIVVGAKKNQAYNANIQYYNPKNGFCVETKVCN